MPVAVHLLTRPGAKAHLSVGAPEVDKETILSIDNRGNPEPFTEARKMGLVVAEVYQPDYGISKMVPSSAYEEANTLDQEVLADLLAGVGVHAADEDYDLVAWQITTTSGARLLLVLPDFMEERDVVTVGNSLQVETAQLKRVLAGSYPVVHLDYMGVAPVYVRGEEPAPSMRMTGFRG